MDVRLAQLLNRNIRSMIRAIVRNRSLPSQNKLEMLLGKVLKETRVGTDRKRCVQVRCKLNQFDEHIKKYYSYPVDLWALDPKIQTALGDTILITKCAEADRPSKSITHMVDRVIFKYGHVIDPIIKKRVIRQQNAEDIELQTKLVKEIIEEPAEHDVLLFDERRDMQRRRLNARKLAIERRSELAKQERILAQRAVHDAESENTVKNNDTDDYPYW